MSLFLRQLAKAVPITIGEMIGSFGAQALIGILEAYAEYYWNNPEGIDTGVGYFIDHPEDMKRNTNILTLLRRIAVDHNWYKIKPIAEEKCRQKQKKG
jgi:hypothetical protein